MKNEFLLKSIAYIDEERIDQAINRKRKKQKLSKKCLKLLPCIALIGSYCFIILTNNTYSKYPLETQNKPKPVDNNIIDYNNIIIDYNNIHINEVSVASDSFRGNIALMADDYIPMSDEEFMDYFSVSLEPLFPDMILQEQSDLGNNGIYKRNGDGIYWDIHSFVFEDKDKTKKLYITMTKIFNPEASNNKPVKELVDETGKVIAYNRSYVSPEDSIESVINDTTMIINHYLQNNLDVYSSTFIYKEKKYSITAENMSKEDFLSALYKLVM